MFFVLKEFRLEKDSHINFLLVIIDKIPMGEKGGMPTQFGWIHFSDRGGKGGSKVEKRGDPGGK